MPRNQSEAGRHGAWLGLRFLIGACAEPVVAVPIQYSLLHHLLQAAQGKAGLRAWRISTQRQHVSGGASLL